MSEWATVRFKRLESFGDFCNAEAEVQVEIQIDSETTDADISDAFGQAVKAVDEQIAAARTRHLTQREEASRMADSGLTKEFVKMMVVAREFYSKLEAARLRREIPF